ncbi:TerD family protein [Streptomyces venezuelae]|uniref:TerD family protein n=1 Tax=Streptomyces venezuelae TaxID=54571 RepID=UPI001CCA31BB|nr:TerD family protein [Streptomyces venezuelae]
MGHMGHMAKGSWVPSVTLRVGAGGVDVAALLLAADGRVRGDADMVFDGQPAHPSGAVRHEQASLVLALHEVEADVERIVIAGSAAGGALAAVAPDGVAVAAHTVAGAPETTAVVLAEFFRESGGWKFAGGGKGYGSGLAALVTEFGVEVADETGAAQQPPEPVAAGPLPLTGVVKMPVRARQAGGASAAGAAPGHGGPPAAGGPFPPADRPYELVGGWEFGPVFEPFTITGDGDQVVTVDDRVPPGPVLVETAHEGRDGYFAVFPLDQRNKDGQYLFSTTLPDFRGSSVTPAPEDRALRLRVRAYHRWVMRVKPVAAARRIEGTLRGYGPEALLYTGGAADLQVHFEGDEDGGGYVGIRCHEVAGHTGLTERPTLLLNRTEPLLHTVPLPPGPLLLLHRADGPWTLTVKELD